MIGSLVRQQDETSATEAVGKRHFVKSSRWVVLGSPDGLLKGTWLPTAQAKQMLSDGDFYDEGTTIQILPAGWTVRVIGKKIFDCESGVEVDP